MFRQLFNVRCSWALCLSFFHPRNIADESRTPRASALRWPVTPRAAHPASLSDHTWDYCWHGITNVTSRSCNASAMSRGVAVWPEREYQADTAIGRVAGKRIEDNMQCENSRHWLAGIPESERKSLSHNSRAPALRSTGQSRPQVGCCNFCAFRISKYRGHHTEPPGRSRIHVAKCATCLDFSRSVIYMADNNIIKFERVV